MRGSKGREHVDAEGERQARAAGEGSTAAELAAAYRDDDAVSRAWCESVCVAHLRMTAVSSGSAEAAIPDVRWPVSGSLDYIDVPAADVDDEALRYVQTLAAGRQRGGSSMHNARKVTLAHRHMTGRSQQSRRAVPRPTSSARTASRSVLCVSTLDLLAAATQLVLRRDVA